LFVNLFDTRFSVASKTAVPFSRFAARLVSDISVTDPPIRPCRVELTRLDFSDGEISPLMINDPNSRFFYWFSALLCSD